MANKRRTKGLGSIYKRKDRKKWTLEVQIGRKDNGKPKKKYYSFSTKKEAEAKLIEINYEKEYGLSINPNELTVEEYIDSWLKYKRNKVKPKTFDGYEQVLRLYVKPYIGKINIQELNSEDINEMNQCLRKKGLSSTTIKNANTDLKICLNYAEKKEIIKKNPFVNVDPIKVEKRQITVLNEEEIKKFLKAIEGTRFEAVYVLLITVGLRVGEVLGLSWYNIDSKNNRIWIDKTIQRVRVFDEHLNKIRSELIINAPKTQKSMREIYLLDTTMKALGKHKIGQDEEKRKVGDTYIDKDFVFATATGKLIDPKNFSRSFKKILKSANLPNIRVHDLRHTFATAALENDMQMKVLQEILGHANYSTTADIYSHVNSKHKRKEMNKLEGVFKV